MAEREHRMAADQERHRRRDPPSSPAAEKHCDAAGYASEQVRDILTTRRPNREGVPPEGMPCPMAAELRIPDRNSGPAWRYIRGRHPETGLRDERVEMVTPTGGTIPAALVVRGQALRGDRFGHRTVDSRNEVPRGGLDHPRDEVPDSGLGHPIAVSEMSVYRHGSLRLVYGRPSESAKVRVSQALSPGASIS